MRLLLHTSLVKYFLFASVLLLFGITTAAYAANDTQEEASAMRELAVTELVGAWGAKDMIELGSVPNFTGSRYFAIAAKEGALSARMGCTNPSDLAMGDDQVSTGDTTFSSTDTTFGIGDTIFIAGQNALDAGYTFYNNMDWPHAHTAFNVARGRFIAASGKFTQANDGFDSAKSSFDMAKSTFEACAMNMPPGM